jgi:Protein of unknown function (DUF1553)/Protein of unknown function (DUF1549)/Concanavalin A-like lectin/glucanases superfamily/Planctomycete cytochrome C
LEFACFPFAAGLQKHYLPVWQFDTFPTRGGVFRVASNGALRCDRGPRRQRIVESILRDVFADARRPGTSGDCDGSKQRKVAEKKRREDSMTKKHASNRLFPGCTLSLFVCAFGPVVARGDTKLEFNRDIRPILADNCFACHGPDSAARKAGLRLDQRDVAIGAKAIIPGKPGESAVVTRINSHDDDELMPPPRTKKSLTAAQKDLLKRWIAEGAEYQPHWSFIAPKRPELPGVKDSDWVRNPIDRFILAELEKRGLRPAPEADRRTLARRLSLDLVGLPPPPAEVEAFVNDRAPDYYEKFVDKLMSSPHWGEHRGRYWLDEARYADTNGIHFDNFRENWAYRDWVIAAFNRNTPFDQFTIEQLAGDLLPNRTLDQQVATGFNRCNITTNEGGAIAEEYLVLYTRDRTETAAAVFLGLTAGCAVCHDHKFDPLKQREFYELSAFFNNTPQAAMDGNIANTPPAVTVPRPEDRQRWEKLTREITTLKDELEARKKAVRADFDQWQATAKSETLAGSLPRNAGFSAPLDEGQGKEISVTVAGKPRKLKLDSGFSWVADRDAGKAFAIQPGPSLEIPDAGGFDTGQAFSVSLWARTTKRNQTGAIVARMETPQKHYRGWDLWLQSERVGTHLISAWPDDAVKVVARDPLPYNKWVHVTMTYDGSGHASGIGIYYDGVLQPVVVEADKLHGSIKSPAPLKIGQRQEGDRVSNISVHDVSIYDQLLDSTAVMQLAKSSKANAVLAKPANMRTPKELSDLFDWWLAANDAPYRQINLKLHALEQEEAAIKGRGTFAHVMVERAEPPSAFVLHRGDYDKRRDKVRAATPQSLPPFPDDLPRNRLGLAKWLLQPEQPLTARVTVNRFWQELFGVGIVRSSGDFGIAGELPSNQPLLDWLAVEFREGGWDVKAFFKMLVTSAAYRQSAAADRDKLEKDPQNRLLSRGPRFRLDGELIRDYALSASGLLVEKIGGPSVKPYQPPGVWEAVAMPESNTRNYKQDQGENLYRRGMYTFWKRAAPPASMEIFNAPNRETCVVRRDRTNTPLQALVTLNDPQMVEAAKMLAQNAVKAGDQDDARLDFMARRLLCRPMRLEEAKIVLAGFNELLAFYRSHADDAAKLLAVGETKVDPKLDASTLAAWTMVANELMNLDEVLNK